MSNNGVSRRSFLKFMGAGSAATMMLANSGLPLALAGDRNLFSVANSSNSLSMKSSPEVELLVGDVTGFSLHSHDWEGAFGWVKFRLHRMCVIRQISNG